MTNETEAKMVTLECVIDVWNLIEKYGITKWTQLGYYAILISEEDYNRILGCVKNKAYVKNLRRY